MKLNQENQRINRIPNGKLILASSLVLFVCTPVQAQPFNSLPLEQSLTFNPSVVPDEVGNFGARTRSPLLAVPPPPPGTGAPRGPRDQAGGRLFNAPRPPRGTGSPRRRRDGGKRGDCEERTTQPTNATVEAQPLIALVPESDGGLTTVERPTFWFYVPAQPSLVGEFVLQKQDGTEVYTTPVTLPAKPEIIRISLPSNVPPLEVGDPYEWYLNIYCKPDNSTEKPSNPPLFVAGWIQRTALNSSVETQLQNATPQQKVALYARNGIWYEALTIAAELYQNNPNDKNWAELLQDVGLGEIASEANVER